jgi:uncharacterized protein GlcG (DUF336 family)
MLASTTVAAETPPSVEIGRLSLDYALKAAQSAIAECSKRGIQVGVTVVDRDGTVQVALRDTIAAPITVPVSRAKAYTAVNFNAATSSIEDRSGTSLAHVDGLLFLAGGVPIEVGGSLLGGIGVSGSPDSNVDEACALAGRDAIQVDLEMAM